MSDLLAVVTGGALALAGSFGAQAWQGRRERKALRAAFRAEISTILHMAEIRKHDQLFRTMVELWETKGIEQPVVVFGGEDLPSDPVFDKNVEKIGTLGADVAGDIGAFYAMMTGVRIDLRALMRGQMGNLTPAQRIDVIKKDLALYDEALALGRRLVERL